MAFFPLKFRCTIERSTGVEDASGQEITTFTTHLDGVKCLYLATSGNKVNTPQEKHKSVMAFYCDPNVDLEEGDKIRNIRTIDGVVLEAGPFMAESVKKVPSQFSGRIHHRSCKLVGVA